MLEALLEPLEFARKSDRIATELCFIFMFLQLYFQILMTMKVTLQTTCEMRGQQHSALSFHLQKIVFFLNPELITVIF